MLRPGNDGLFAFAGLWEHWDKAPDGAPLESRTTITTAASQLLRSLHNRMPAILVPDEYAAWLGEDAVRDVAELIRPYPSEEMRAYRVGTAVNGVRNDGPERVEAAARSSGMTAPGARPISKHEPSTRPGFPGIHRDQNEREGTIMKTAGLAFLVAGLICGAAASAAQSSFNNYGPVVPPGLLPYGEPTQVPPNGCVWENLVYSNGAVIARGVPLTTYFQCDRGTWTVISSGDAIFGRRVPEAPGSSQPTRP